MSASWNALRARFLRQSQTTQFAQQFWSMRAGKPALEPFSDPRGVLEYLRHSSGSAAAKNRVLRTLLECHQEDAECASVLLSLALWPALDRAYRNLCWGFQGDTAAVAGELIGAFGETVAKADPDKITSVAKTLAMNAKRDATSTLKRHKLFADCLDPEIEARVDELQHQEHALEMLLRENEGAVLRENLQQDYGNDGALVYDTLVNDLSQREAAELRGLPYERVRKRIQRTTYRIHRDPPDYLSPRVPKRIADWHLSNDGDGWSGTAEDTANVGKRRSTRTAAGSLPSVGTARDPADRRRVPNRARRKND